MAQTDRFVQPTATKPQKTIIVQATPDPMVHGMAKAIEANYKTQVAGYIAPTKARRLTRRDTTLARRLVAGAQHADADRGTDTTGMGDDQFLALLRRR